jgi:DNA-binding NtrC family response regulator
MTALQEVHSVETRAKTAKVISVLAVSPFEEDHARLREIFRHSRWKLYSTLTWGEAFQAVELADVSLIICEQQCPEGNWRDLFARIDQLPNPIPFVVCSRSPDLDLWAEAINEGAFDVLSKPFDTFEVLRTVPASWQYYRHDRSRIDVKIVRRSCWSASDRSSRLSGVSSTATS